jgi:hypothetical protein
LLGLHGDGGWVGQTKLAMSHCLEINTLMMMVTDRPQGYNAASAATDHAKIYGEDKDIFVTRYDNYELCKK